jgi:hypothetical protein
MMKGMFSNGLFDPESRVVTSDTPIPTTVTLWELVEWVVYLNTKRTDDMYLLTTHAAKESVVRRYVAKTDYYLRDKGIWK